MQFETDFFKIICLLTKLFSNNMYKYILIIYFIFFCSLPVFSFDSLLFKPLTANQLESRLGSFYEFDDNRLRLDIGHSLDLYQFNETNNENILIDKSDNSNCTARLGGDFFILSRLRSEGRMKFPVETSDFYFGINASCKFLFEDLNFASRLRIAHISSHLVDGYSSDGEFWQQPFVYSREFIDLVIALQTNNIRPYLGATYIFSTIPENVNKFVPQIGFDFDYNLYKFIYIMGGYDFKVIGAENLPNIGCNSLQAGILFNISKNIGISINYYYYSGYSIHGMFYNTKDKYNALGFQINY